MRDKGSNGEHAAAQNRATLLCAIHRNAPISRSELALRSRLTKQAVTRIVERLLDEGLILEARRRQGARGQPAIELEIDPDGLHAVGANIDRDHMTIVAVDGLGRVRARVHREKRFMLPDECMALMDEALTSFFRRRLISKDRLAGIGLAIPDWLGEIPVSGFPEAYGAWSGFDVRMALAGMTGHAVFIDNDANAAALGEIEYGLGREIASFLLIQISACLGGCLVTNSRLHKGAHGLGGEVGWLPVTVEAGPHAGENRPIGDVFSILLLLDHLRDAGYAIETPADLLSLDPRGKAMVSAWLKRFALKLTDAVIDIGMIMDPDGVVIGGRLPVRLIDELLLYMHEDIARRGSAAPSLHRAASAEDAAARGAAAMALAHRLGLPSAEDKQRTRLPMSSQFGTTYPAAAPVATTLVLPASI